MILKTFINIQWKKKHNVNENIYRFVKKVFFVGFTILSNFTNATPLNCISMKNQECKTRLQVININSNNLYFTLLVLKFKNLCSWCYKRFKC